MDNGLFGIYQSRDIYFTLDMLRVLSHPSVGKRTVESGENKKEDGGEEQKES